MDVRKLETEHSFPFAEGKSAPELTHGTRDMGDMGMIQWAPFAGRNVITSADTKAYLPC